VEVEYEITPDDLYAFQWRAAYSSSRSTRTRRKVYIYCFLTLLLCCSLPAIGSDGFVVSRVNFTFFSFAFPLIAFVYWFLYRRLTRRAILELLQYERPNKGQLGKHKLILNEEGVFESTMVGESRTLWAGVDRIEKNQDYLFIYTSPAGAHIIPKHAFSNTQEAESFYQLARVSKGAAA
jgi:hypothetical protein